MGTSDDAGISRTSAIPDNGGHEVPAAAHVRAEMLALASTTVTTDPIVELIHEGRHRDALAACARTHHAVLGRLAMALLGSQADADEAVQETLLRAHRAMPSYRGEGSIKAWLCGIARHVCAHMLETRRRGRELLEVVPPEGDDGRAGREARDVFAARRRARALRDALEKLKPSEREVLVLRFVADLSHREIGMACGLDEATARKRISRALDRLRSVMPTEEI
jgi:RNA polymerase sigma-70 factor (ECF subfamily)